jgi:hypothetical protein
MVVRVRVTGGDLDIPEVDAGVEHGRDRGVAEHMGCALAIRMPALPASWCRRPVAACRSIRAPRLLSRIGPRMRDPVDGPADRWRQRDQDDLGALAAHTEDPVAVLLAEVGDVRAGGLEDPQAQQTEHGHQREIVRVRRFSCCGEQRLELQVGEPQVGDSAGTMGATDVLGR